MLRLPLGHQLASDFERLLMTHRLPTLETLHFHAGLAVTQDHDYATLFGRRRLMSGKRRTVLRVNIARPIRFGGDQCRRSHERCECERGQCAGCGSDDSWAHFCLAKISGPSSSRTVAWATAQSCRAK